jgi:DNA-binding MarR family transcriptional regulator
MSVATRTQSRRFESASQQAIVALLVAAAAVLQRMNDVLREHGITHDQYNVLRILRGAQPDGHPRGEIGRRMMSRAPDVTRLLDRLERQGLIARGWAPENRRLSMARITPAGLALLEAADPEVLALQMEATRGLTMEQLATIAAACDRIAG